MNLDMMTGTALEGTNRTREARKKKSKCRGNLKTTEKPAGFLERASLQYF